MKRKLLFVLIVMSVLVASPAGIAQDGDASPGAPSTFKPTTRLPADEAIAFPVDI
ncbi:MAG: hypothetical protein AAF533_15815 [Acidobacteriota bacterium]